MILFFHGSILSLVIPLDATIFGTKSEMASVICERAESKSILVGSLNLGPFLIKFHNLLLAIKFKFPVKTWP